MLYEAKQGSKAYEYIKGVLDAEFVEKYSVGIVNCVEFKKNK